MQKKSTSNFLKRLIIIILDNRFQIWFNDLLKTQVRSCNSCLLFVFCIANRTNIYHSIVLICLLLSISHAFSYVFNS